MNLFIFGLGYSALYFVRQQRNTFVRLAGTVRSEEKQSTLSAEGIETFRFSADVIDPQIRECLRECDDIIISAGPDAAGDPVLKAFGAEIAGMPLLKRIIYLSTVGVYGDHQGAWVDEASQVNPASERSLRRLEAERGWIDLSKARACDLHILRLAGIYGPGRNALENIRNGKARRIVKKDQVFNRIHVEDICRSIIACLAHPLSGSSHVWNISDNEPAPPQDVVSYAAQLACVNAPPEISFDEAGMTPMARSFYGENKRVSNRAMREELGVQLAFPSYREGLQSLTAKSAVAACPALQPAK